MTETFIADKFTIDSHRCRFPNIDKGNFARKGKVSNLAKEDMFI